MTRRCARLAVVASLLCAMGMPAAVLQMAAWAKMTVDFARGGTVGASIEKTLNGKHPCSLCRRVAAAADPGQSLAAARPYSRLGYVSPSSAPHAERADSVRTLTLSSPLKQDRALAPPTPPPPDVLA